MAKAKADERLVVSVPEAGRVLGLGRNAAYEAVKRGEIPVLRFGKLLKVPTAWLERVLRGETGEAA
jgi:excisionase family DNA binding protein